MLLFDLIYGLGAAFSIMILSAWKVANYAEQQQMWTLRLRLSMLQPYILPPWIILTSAAIILAFYDLFASLHFDLTNSFVLVSMYFVIGCVIILAADLAWRAFHIRGYLRLRWKAWSGPSRTGISPTMAIYIGDSADWVALHAAARNVQPHPVERFAGSFFCKGKGIAMDPTDLLRFRATLDQKELRLSIPQSRERSGMYQPIAGDQSASLLWGEHLGFQRRCSRGIISITPNLLRASPKLNSGLDGKAVCVAYAILARNKGLQPATLICNLKAKNSFQSWEEGSLWPLPAKTLRSFYYTEFMEAFSLLGESYVTAAAELAVLLTDLDPVLIGEWLDMHFEHQDLEFNLEAYSLGAGEEDLGRIYRGHYAAMLISLSLVHKDIQIRPEITVFDAVCNLENAAIPIWALSDSMNARRNAELAEYGPSLKRLVYAVI